MAEAVTTAIMGGAFVGLTFAAIALRAHGPEHERAATALMLTASVAGWWAFGGPVCGVACAVAIGASVAREVVRG